MNKRQMMAQCAVFALMICVTASAVAQPEDVVAVLGSDSRAYQEALAGIRDTFGASLTVINLASSEKIPPTAKLIITIGGKAVVASERINTPLIYCLAPGVDVNRDRHPNLVVKVFMSPPPQVLLAKLQEIQPDLKRLGAVWVDDPASSYGTALKAEGGRRRVEVRPYRLRSLEELPDYLRGLKGHIDALWLPPDPLLINPKSFNTIKQFGLDNGIPFYASIDALADQGAVAAISVSFREMGHKAGAIAAQIMSGNHSTGEQIFGDTVSVTLNLKSAAGTGLKFPPAAVKQVDRVIP